MANPCIQDSECIALSVEANGNLEANLILDPDAENCLECGVDGLHLPLGNCLTCGVSGLNVLVANGSCLSCTVDGLDVDIDPDEYNGLSCTDSGLYVLNHESTLLSDSNSTVPGSSLAGNSVDQGIFGPFINWEDLVNHFGTGTTVYLTGYASISYTNNSPEIQNFLTFWGMGNPGFTMRNGWGVSIGNEHDITSPHLTGTNAPSVVWDAVEDPFASGTRFGLTFPPQTYSVESFLNPGESVTTRCRSYAIASTEGATSAGGGNASTGAQYFGVTTALYVWTN